MVMQGDECFGPGLTCVDRGVLVGMRSRRLGPRLSRTHALCEPCVCRTGISPSVCGRRTRAELHIQDMPPRMLPSSAALRRGASCTHPCCSFPCSGLRAHGTLHSPRPSIGEAMQALASLSASARCRVGVGPWECRILERSRISRPCMQDPQYGLLRIYLPRTPVNKGKEKGRGSMTGPVTVREQAPVAARPPDCRSDPNPRLSCRPQSGAC